MKHRVAKSQDAASKKLCGYCMHQVRGAWWWWLVRLAPIYGFDSCLLVTFYATIMVVFMCSGHVGWKIVTCAVMTAESCNDRIISCVWVWEKCGIAAKGHLFSIFFSKRLVKHCIEAELPNVSFFLFISFFSLFLPMSLLPLSPSLIFSCAQEHAFFSTQHPATRIVVVDVFETVSTFCTYHQ
jgi:hypothetical protein